MTSHRILQLNAMTSAACALGMLATRGVLHPLFGLDAPILLDVLAVGLLAYAGALAFSAQRQPVSRQVLILYTVGDLLWVAGSALVLLLFWTQLAPLARLLIVAAAAVVEVFATLQFRAAGGFHGGSPQMA